jgi:hypothetical protein
MGNETEKNFQQQPSNPTGTVDPSKKNPSQGGQSPNQQDPSKKNPSQTDDARRDREDSSEQGEKRRAS